MDVLDTKVELQAPPLPELKDNGRSQSNSIKGDTGHVRRQSTSLKQDIEDAPANAGCFTGCLKRFYALQEEHPWLKALSIFVARVLFAADIVTDWIVVSQLLDQGHPNWGYTSMSFCLLPYFVLWILLMPAVRVFVSRYGVDVSVTGLLGGREYGQFLLWVLLGPVWLVMGDVALLTVYLWRDLPIGTDILMFYSRQRALVEVMLESLPQVCLQVYIRFWGDGFVIDDLSLSISIVASVLSVLKAVGRVHAGSQASKQPFFKYMRAVVTGGGTADGVGGVERAIQDIMAGVESVEVLFSGIDDEGAKLLADALQQNRTLTSLNLAGNQIGDEGAKALAEALTQNRTLTSLSLGANNIGAEGVKALADALKQNRTLTNLDLGANNIGAEGAKEMAGALQQNRTLTSLDLGNNEIGDEGAKVLADALKQNRTLTNLNLDYNSIGAEGAKALADALQQNRTLTSLDLDGNEIGDEGAKALADALKQNRTLTSLDLNDNDIDTGVKNAIKDALERNKRG